MESSIPPGFDLSKIPIGSPPTGVAPNFVNPQTLAPTILAVSIVILVLTIAVVFLRLYARLYSHSTVERKLGYDDYSCIVATVLLVGLTGLTINMRGYARHDYDTPLSWLVPSESKQFFANDMITGPSIFFAKTSLFLLYYRVFAPKKLIRMFIIIGIIFAFVIYILIFIPLMASLCAPHVGQEWDLMVLKKCRRALAFGVVQATTNLIIDLYILALPIPVVLQLQLPTKKKIGILAIFMTGLFAIVSSIIGLFYRIKLLGATDVYWNVFSVEICVEVDCGVTIMCSSMPALTSFSRTLAAQSTYYASLRSRLFSYYGKGGSKSKLNKSVSSGARTQVPEHKTTVDSAGTASHDFEKGIMLKSISVDQSSDEDSFRDRIAHERAFGPAQ